MYCSSCGRQVDAGLSYCNQCGARLSSAPDPRAIPAGNYNTLLGAVIGIPIVGITMIFVFIAALKNGMGFKDDFIAVMVLLTFFLLAIAEIGCLIMLMIRTKGPKTPKRSSADHPHTLPNRTAPAIAPATFDPISPGSITDHTTRTLDHVPGQRESE
jgi:predicted lipid-binding transport protein (Tim44 family)